MVIYSTGLFKQTGKEHHMELFRVPTNPPDQKVAGQGYNGPLNFAHTNVMVAPLTAFPGDKWTIYAASIHSPSGPLPCSNHARWRFVFNYGLTFHQGHIHLYAQPTPIGPYEIKGPTIIAAAIDLDAEYPIPETGLELTISLWISNAVQIG